MKKANFLAGDFFNCLRKKSADIARNNYALAANFAGASVAAKRRVPLD